MSWIKRIARITAMLGIVLSLWGLPQGAVMADTLTIGSQGQDVIDLQSRLGYLGYYHGTLTGTYTDLTAAAVRNFQSAFGMPVTGQYDAQTAQRLHLATAGWPGVGRRGPQISELQSRLKFLGYYTGPINGIYDWRTYWAVRDFQYAFGMPVNGSLTAQTWDKLDKATVNWPGNQQTQAASSNTATPPASSQTTNTAQNNQTATSVVNVANSGGTDGFSQNDINLMAHVVYGEARNQPFVGQVAVAAVILNRYHSNLFPHSIPAIIYQPGAFTSISNGQAWLGLHQENVRAVMDAIHGWDPTNGALYYWNPATSTSQWIWSQPIMLRIGNHVFAK
ncbi:spore cortex-lytic enzyme [Sulfoacidibacillus thermotolerans]|uniref:Spore cortex-lytic enzyme n=1 Tax=Sulfoacidibacillus thermotolerans TaxID=1765684 RepID=A0A2U3DCP6_SULT2|nr:spore cortex-lytic enzyme [Sulfoacidibacillus thermotolerans]PWI59059.1 spore cortex-lytic enzyme [Sulfoacidibacillus thermotolerans]